jgi:hypothetical protein
MTLHQPEEQRARACEVRLEMGWAGRREKGWGGGETLQAMSERNEHGGDNAAAAEAVSDVCSSPRPYG